MQKHCSHKATSCDRSKQRVSSQQGSNNEKAEETMTHRNFLFSFVAHQSLRHDSQEEADKEEERELTPDEIGRKIASQWTTDPDAAGSSLESGSEEQEEELDEEEEDAVDDDDHEVWLGNSVFADSLLRVQGFVFRVWGESIIFRA